MKENDIKAPTPSASMDTEDENFHPWLNRNRALELLFLGQFQ